MSTERPALMAIESIVERGIRRPTALKRKVGVGVNKQEEVRTARSLSSASSAGSRGSWVAAALPKGVEVANDIGPATWIELSASRHHGTVGALLPDTFAAYARVFHPAYQGDSPVRWSTVASWTDRHVHPLMAFDRIAAIPDGPKNMPAWGSRPATGQGPISALVTILRSFTTSPERCSMGLWDGFGGLDMVRELETAPRLRLPQRSFILFSGPFDAIEAFGRAGPPWLPPNLWWPDDRAWFVSTDIALASTYVGGSRVCIDAILSAEEVEALPASVDDPLGVAADTINPSTTSGST